MPQRKIAVIGVANAYGAGDPACQDGPEILRRFEFLDDLAPADGTSQWDETLRPSHESAAGPLPALSDMTRRLATAVRGHLAAGNFPLVIGGDHSCAIGTWSGVHAHLESRGPGARLGLIWIDAHMDSHAVYSGSSQNIHDMPLACLLGHGAPQLSGIADAAPTLRPQDVCLIGVRSFEWREAALLLTLGVRIYYMQEVHERGMSTVLQEARRHVCRETAGYGISIDLDALDPLEESGVGTPVPDGLLRAELIQALAPLRGDTRLQALEVVEYNPDQDPNFTTAQAVHDLCCSLLEPALA